MSCDQSYPVGLLHLEKTNDTQEKQNINLKIKLNLGNEPIGSLSANAPLEE